MIATMLYNTEFDHGISLYCKRITIEYMYIPTKLPVYMPIWLYSTPWQFYNMQKCFIEPPKMLDVPINSKSLSPPS